MPLIYTREDPRFYDQRLYKGGDGGAGQMRAQEEERQRKVQSAVDAINAQFGAGPGSARPEYTPVALTGGLGDVSRKVKNNVEAIQVPGMQAEWDAVAAVAEPNRTAREAQYTDIAGAVRDTAIRDLDRQYGKASQKNKFGLARSGLLGGTADAEAGGELSTLYGEGRLKAQQAGMGAASELRSADEQTRQRLISMAQSGLDTGTAGSLAADQMSAAAGVARSQAGGATVGRLFDDLSQAYVSNELAKVRRPQQDPNGASYGGFGGNRYTGTIQR
jgi:hypothetical protein